MWEPLYYYPRYQYIGCILISWNRELVDTRFNHFIIWIQAVPRSSLNQSNPGSVILLIFHVEKWDTDFCRNLFESNLNVFTQNESLISVYSMTHLRSLTTFSIRRIILIWTGPRYSLLTDDGALGFRGFFNLSSLGWILTFTDS